MHSSVVMLLRDMEIRVYKFGGASVAQPALVDNLRDIVADVRTPLVVVISAIGKTTNALEQIVNNYYEGNYPKAKEEFALLEEFHKTYIKELFGDLDVQPLMDQLNSFFTEIDWIISDEVTQSYDFYYDQIVSVGELLSTAIVAYYLSCHQMKVKWMDVRDVLRTDDTYRDARVDIDYSQQRVQDEFLPILQQGTIIITQGFIGSTDQNTSTTLGREGSDYTASLLASMLSAQSVSIWKDVKGLMNADPRLDPNAVIIPEIPYSEVIEMAYYGAQVIHPKTIKPLYNARIPMYVKCFLDKTLPGTLIGTDRTDLNLPPISVVKDNQLMVRFTTLDFSFFDEKNLSRVYQAFDSLNIKQNMTYISAISLDLVINDKRDIEKLIINALQDVFKIEFRPHTTIKTVRHYNDENLKEFYELPEFFLVERTPLTLQYVI